MKQSESVSISLIFGLREKFRSPRLLIKSETRNLYWENEKVDLIVTQQMDKSVEPLRSFF